VWSSYWTKNILLKKPCWSHSTGSSAGWLTGCNTESLLVLLHWLSLSWWTFFAAFVYITIFAPTDVKPIKQNCSCWIFFVEILWISVRLFYLCPSPNKAWKARRLVCLAVVCQRCRSTSPGGRELVIGLALRRTVPVINTFTQIRLAAARDELCPVCMNQSFCNSLFFDVLREERTASHIPTAVWHCSWNPGVGPGRCSIQIRFV
jgi:hypothetical protein